MTSKVKVNTIETESGSTLTLGQSGDTVTLASGASQSGFGRTGTVDWQTTPKTSSFTAASGEGYFVNTTSGSVTMTMPSGSAGAIVSIQDYNKTFDTNSMTITPASGEKINGGSADGSLIVSTEGQGITFIYVDSTVGWKTVHENEFTNGGSNFITATGGTITTCGNCKVHTFTSPGTFAITGLSPCSANNLVSYMVIGGGGGGGGTNGGDGTGGGGAGGFRELSSPSAPYTASPLDGYPSSPNRITVTSTSYPITVGAGGTGGPDTEIRGTNGSDSIFSTITSAGGGAGGPKGNPRTGPTGVGSAGGSGGGGGGGSTSPAVSGGTGNTPPTTPSQGNNGGSGGGASPDNSGGGGGGAGAVGQPNATRGSSNPANVSHGGVGVTSEITFSPVNYAGGGGGGSYGNMPITSNTNPASPYGGGLGGFTNNQTAGTANRGGGGGGGGANPPAPQTAGASGGSGIVVIRYKYQ